MLGSEQQRISAEQAQSILAAARKLRDWSCYRWQVYGLAHVAPLDFPADVLWFHVQVVAAAFQSATGVKFLALPAMERGAIFDWLGKLEAPAGHAANPRALLSP